MIVNTEKTGLRRRILLRTSVTALLASGAMTMNAYAQDVETVPDAAEEAADESRDTIVVTGSRLRKDAFSSPSPLTTLDVDQSRRIGVTSITELLSRSTVNNGTQIDSTLNTNAGNANATEQPPAGGTGSSNISLRGLGPERTLVLMNGRRLAPAGVRGAPAQPDISLIPFQMIERAEIATEAGSSVYGADAVAGTVNIILRNDFEGLEFTANYETPEAAGGSQVQVGFMAGAQGDRARIVFGVEYYDRQRVSGFQRDFTSPGLRRLEFDAGGNVFSAPDNGFFDDVVLAIFEPADIWFVATPGQTDAGIPNFSTSNFLTSLIPTGSADLGGIGNRRYDDQFSDNDERRNADLVGDLERTSILTTGEVDLDWFGTDNQFYFEAFYFDRQTQSIATTEQIFPDIPGLIPQEDANGNIIVDGTGAAVLVDNPLNPFPTDVVPIYTLENLPQTRDVELQQVRLVGGLRGDLATGGWLAENNWTYDAYFSFDRGTGFVAQPILNGTRLALATQTIRLDAGGNVVCGPLAATAPAAVGGLTLGADCVPFDGLSAGHFGPNGDGRLSDAEFNYLIGNRTNRTTIEQYVANAFVQGDLMESPWGGAISAGVGFEYRKDIIDSQNSFDGVRQNIAAENPLLEGETRGSRNLVEFFGEVDIPLIVDKPGIKLLNIDAAVRYTDESNFGSDVTWRTRVQYRPVDWFGLSGGYGTSFRAPNLREQFLADQGGGESGFLDPCLNNNIVAAIPAGGDSDTNFQRLVGECQLSGVNSFIDSDMNGFVDSNLLGTLGVTTIPTTSGGNETLLPETSRTFTFTAQAEQPWFKGFDFNVAVSYYDIKIDNTVSEPTASIIINNCYFDTSFPGQTSPFCSLITRPTGGSAASRIINGIDLSFFNIGEVTAKGLDVDTRFGMELGVVSGNVLDWALTTRTAIQLEQEIETFDPTDRDDNLREIGTPKYRVNVGSVFNWGDFTLASEHRYIGAQQQDDDGIDPDQNPFFLATLITQPVDFVDSLWYHDVSLTYSQDSFSISAGVNNIADKAPPLIDSGAGPNRLNAVSSSGYDFFGRSYFVTGRVNF